MNPRPRCPGQLLSRQPCSTAPAPLRRKYMPTAMMQSVSGGGCRIRTHGSVAGTAAFKAAAFVRSANPPPILRSGQAMVYPDTATRWPCPMGFPDPPTPDTRNRILIPATGCRTPETRHPVGTGPSPVPWPVPIPGPSSFSIGKPPGRSKTTREAAVKKLRPSTARVPCTGSSADDVLPQGQIGDSMTTVPPQFPRS